MKLLEYQAKQVFRDHGIKTPSGEVVDSAETARDIAVKLGSVAVKAQLPIGGRGKAGGIRFADSPYETEKVANELLKSVVSGVRVKRLLVEEKMEFTKELYLGIVVDRKNGSYVVLASKEGGVNIEDVALKSPEKIIRHIVNPMTGLRDYHCRRVAKLLGFSEAALFSLSEILKKLYHVAWEMDAELTEINPLVLTSNGFVALDARLNIDDNALFRHKDLVQASERDGFSDLTSREKDAKDLGLTYVELDGNIGIVGNGAGLTMATLDTVAIYGGHPANFLDLGGGASAEKIETGVSFVMKDSRVKAIFVNILGGITRCDDIAKGLILARNQLNFETPIVVRLVGTNEEIGRQILEKNGITILDTMEEAAEKVVSVAKGE
jgi:succinyl-CoA synthetase beta subunit